MDGDCNLDRWNDGCLIVAPRIQDIINLNVNVCIFFFFARTATSPDVILLTEHR